MPVLVTALNALVDWGNSINRGAGGSSSGSGKSNKTQSGSGDQKSLLSASTASVLVEKLEHVVGSSAPIRASLKVSMDFLLCLLTRNGEFLLQAHFFASATDSK